MTQLAQCLGFNLANPFACDVELLADFFERVVGRHFDAEAHAQHFGFAWRQGVEHFLAQITRWKKLANSST